MLVNENSRSSAGDIVVGDNYVMKDHGDYVQVNIDADTPKGHVSYYCSSMKMTGLYKGKSRTKYA